MAAANTKKTQTYKKQEKHTYNCERKKRKKKKNTTDYKLKT